MHLPLGRRIGLVMTAVTALTLTLATSPAHAATELLPMPGAYSCASATNAGAQAWALRPITVTTAATVTAGQALVAQNPASRPSAIDIRSNTGVGTSSWTLVGTLTQSASTASGSQFLASYSGSVSLTPGTYWITVRQVSSSGLPWQSVCNTMSPSPQSPWSFASLASPNYYYTSDNGTSYGTAATIPDVPFVSLSADSTSSAGSGTDRPPLPILQQFGRLVAGSCDAVAPESLNWGGVPSGRWGESWAYWMNEGLGGDVCTRSLVYNTSSRAWMID
jgi:hypothetical protein